MPGKTNLTIPVSVSDADLLAAVRRCILEVTLLGQSFAMDGMEMTRADLDKLRKMEADLATRAVAADLPRGGVRTTQVVF